MHYKTSSFTTEPHLTVTGLSPAELLMGRQLNDKLPRVTIPNDRITHTHWQQLLHERGARGKLRQKEYGDSKRSAEYSHIAEGDQLLLKAVKTNYRQTSSQYHTKWSRRKAVQS